MRTIANQRRIERVDALRLSVVLMLGIVFTEGNTHADEIPAHVRDALSANAAAAGQISLTWERRNLSSLPLGQVSSTLEVDGAAFLAEKVEVEFVLQDGMYYEKHTLRMPQPGKEPRVRVRETSFDEELYYNGTGEEIANTGSFPVISMERPSDVLKRFGVDSRVIDTGYFDNVAIQVPCRLSMLGSPPASLILLEAGNPENEVGMRTESLAGRECTVVDVVKASARLSYYLDPNYNYAVRRREERTGTGSLKVRCENDGFVRIGATQAWLPKQCEEAYFYSPFSSNGDTVSDAPLFRTQTVVSRISTSLVPTEKFTLRYNVPGTIVGDGTLPGAGKTDTGRIDYRVPANSEHLEGIIAAAVQRQGYIPVYRRGWFLIILINVIFVCVIALLAWRSRSGRVL